MGRPTIVECPTHLRTSLPRHQVEGEFTPSLSSVPDSGSGRDTGADRRSTRYHGVDPVSVPRSVHGPLGSHCPPSCFRWVVDDGSIGSWWSRLGHVMGVRRSEGSPPSLSEGFIVDRPLCPSLQSSRVRRLTEKEFPCAHRLSLPGPGNSPFRIPYLQVK